MTTPAPAAVFSRRVRRVVVALALVSFVATAAALLWGRRLTGPAAGDRDSYGRGPLGHHALAAFLEAAGVHVVRLRRGGSHVEVPAPLLLLEPSTPEVEVAGVEHRLEDVLLARAERGLISVLVLPKWRLEPGVRGATASAERPHEMRKVLEAAFVDQDVPEVVRDGAAGDPPVPISVDGSLGTFTLHVPLPQSLSLPPAAETLLGPPERALVARPLGGNTLVVSEPDLLHNYNLQRGDHAALVLALVADFLQTDTVVVDEVFHGHGLVPSLPAALGRFPALLLSLHGLALALLLVAAGARRFGPPVPARRALGRGPREVIAVAAAVLASGQPVWRLAAAYVDRVLDDLVARLGLADASGDPLALLDAVARRRRVPPLARALRQRSLELQGAEGKPGRALRLARRAFFFRRRLLGEGPAADSGSRSSS